MAPPNRRLRYSRIILPALVLLFGALAYGDGLLTPTLPFTNDGTLRKVAIPFHPDLPLQPGDTVLLVNGHTPDAWADAGISALSAPSARYELTIQRGDQTIALEVAAERIPIGLALQIWGGALALGLAALLVAALIGLVGGPSTAEQGVRLAFLGLALYFCILPLTVAPPLAWVFEPLLAPAQILGIGLTGGIIVFFLGYRRATRVWHPRLLPLAVYGAGIAGPAIAWALVPGTSLRRATILTEQIANVVAGVIALLAIGLSVRAYQRNREPLVRAQFRWLLWGVLVGVIPWLALWGVPTLLLIRKPVPLSVALLPMLALPFSFALASLRYRLLDVDVVLSRTLVYLALTVGLGLGYVLVAGISGQIIPALLGESGGTIVPFLITILLAALFNPALRLARRLVDGMLYPGRRALREQIGATMRELRNVEGWGALLPLLNEQIPRMLRVGGAQVLVWDDRRFVPPPPPDQPRNQEPRTENRFGRAGLRLSAPGSSPIAGEVRLPRGWPLERPIVLQSWSHEPGRGVDSELPPELEPLAAAGYQIAFVLVSGGRPVGLYALGRPLSGDWYDRSTIRSLGELADRVAGAVENANLLDQTAAQARLRHELTIARRIQESLLPHNHLCHDGLEVAALTVPASDVGGDLYAVESLPSGSLVLAVGDISGKGVGAALLMAVTSTMLTTIAGDEAPPALLARLNQLLRGYTARNRQNVALCYLRIGPAGAAGHPIVAAGAGAIPPLLRRADGTLEWLPIAGLPLGTAIEQPYYQAAAARLCPGDLLLLCTDGLLEARDQGGALLSFGGVERALAAAPRAASAQEVTQHLMAALQAYTGGRELEDDVTVMVVKVAAIA